jgi:hypothetical protein
MSVDPDGPRAASHLNMAGHLTGPFAAGARDDEVIVGSSGRAAVSRTSREPLLLAAPIRSLADRGLRLRAELRPARPPGTLAQLDFAPYTEAGAYLPLHRPPVNPVTNVAAPFAVVLTLAEVEPDGTELPLAAAEIAIRVELRLIEGVLGRLLYALGAEKMRLRRVGREIVAMRRLASARDDALDRVGAELSVPRLTDQIVMLDGEIESTARREPDDEFRRRLAIYRPFMLANRSRLVGMLNGPGAGSDPNRGLLAGLDVTDRFGLVEGDTPFAIAVHLVSADTAAPRDNFLTWVRDTHLVWPQNTPQGNVAHASRYLPQATRDRVTDLRRDLRAFLAFDGDAATNPALAPFLAEALVRVGRCRAALGVETAMTLLRAQMSDRGSRYELGLGVDLRLFPAAELDALALSLADPARSPAPDPQTEALLISMRPQPAASDPLGRWLLEPCGLRTVHRVDSETVYVSHLPNFGLVITGPGATDPPAVAAAGNPLFFEARYQAPGDPGANAVLQAGLIGAAEDWAGRGGPAWTVLDDETARLRRAEARTIDIDTPEPVGSALAGGGLTVLADPSGAVETLEELPGELHQTLQLDPGQAAELGTGSPDAANDLLALVGFLRANGLTSALPLVAGGGDILLVVGVIGLPGAGLNLDERRATGFRWYVVPIVPGEPAADLSAAGSRAVLTPHQPGLSAVVVLGYARTTGSADPYQYRVTLPDGSLLDLRQYEFLMNLLDHTFPAGVEVDTFSIRRRHVDVDGDGVADPLPPTASQTFRRFRTGRSLGVPDAGPTTRSTK